MPAINKIIKTNRSEDNAAGYHQVETALWKEKAYFTPLFESTHEVIGVAGDTGRALRINRHFQQPLPSLL